MKKEYKRALHLGFAREFLAKHPEYMNLTPAKPFFSKDELVLGIKRESGQGHFVILSPHPSGHEAFTIEVGWSMNGEQPRLAMRPSAGDPTVVTADTCDEFVTRLAYLDQNIPEFWYVEQLPFGMSAEQTLRQILESTKPITPEQAIARVQESLSSALAATEAVGLPFLQKKSVVTERSPQSPS